MYPTTSQFPVPIKNDRQVFPFKEMAVGDSFCVPAPHGNQTLQVRSARVAQSKLAKNSTLKFTSRLENDVVRFWRTA